MLILESESKGRLSLEKGYIRRVQAWCRETFPTPHRSIISTGAVLRRFPSPLQASAPAGSVILEPDLEICDAAQTGTPVCLLAASPELL